MASTMAEAKRRKWIYRWCGALALSSFYVGLFKSIRWHHDIETLFGYSDATASVATQWIHSWGTNPAGPTTRTAIMTEDEDIDMEVDENEEELEQFQLESNSANQIPRSLSLSFTPQNPVFVLGLPNSGSLVMDRYFKCAGLDEQTLGRRWTRINWGNETVMRRAQIGKCINYNLIRQAYYLKRQKMGVSVKMAKPSKDPLSNCGRYTVWMDMDYVEKDRAVKMALDGRKCFMPTARSGFALSLFRSYPNATIVHVMEDPETWYDTLSPMTRNRWSTWCQKKHGNAFPDPSATKAKWMDFYRTHNRNLRNEIRRSSFQLIAVDLDKDVEDTAMMLQDKLEIPSTCWSETAMATTTTNNDNNEQQQQQVLRRDIRFPIFVTALPKSATSTANAFLNCGLGAMEGAHQWTNHEHSLEELQIGECMHTNIKANRSILHDCGDHSHWGDIGALQPEFCFYPTMHDNGLQAMYEAYPYGTIMNVLRNATKWFQSVKKWGNLHRRWAKRCQGFPALNATPSEWVDFYHWHTNHVRQFAKDHPTMTYVEIDVEQDAAELQEQLQQQFGFPSFCWGHRNANNGNHPVLLRSVPAKRGERILGDYFDLPIKEWFDEAFIKKEVE